MKLCGKTAGVLLGLGNQDTLYAREAVVHATLRVGESEVRVHTDDLRGSNLLEAHSPADQPNAKLRLQSVASRCGLELGRTH